MTQPLFIQAMAELDIQSIYVDLESQRRGSGNSFRRQLFDVFQHIEAMPEMYGIVWEDVRAARLRNYRYVVYYVVLSDRTEIIAVMHGSRQSSHWQDRR